MPRIASYDELKKLHQEYAKRIHIRLKDSLGSNTVISYSMAKCDAALGTEIMDVLLKELQANSLYHIPVLNNASLEHATMEPLLCVNDPNGSSAIYGQLNADKVRRIVKEHLVGGKVCEDLLLPQLSLPKE